MSQRPFLLGLTGSIAMGKTTTAGMFADEGVPVWDADATVHKLYSMGGAAVEPIRRLCPSAIINDAVFRPALKCWISQDHAALGKIEGVVHPLVAADREAFIQAAIGDMAVLDIPLLFETGGENDVDAIAVVSAPPGVQRERFLERSGVTEAEFETMLARQMPDSEKRKRADYLIETVTPEGALAAVRSCLEDIKMRLANA